MKQFNIDEYLKNPDKKVITRDGRDVTIHCTNCVGIQPVVAEIEGDNYSTYFCKDGRYLIKPLIPSVNDLFFVSKKHEGWAPVYRDVDGTRLGILCSTKEMAEEVGKGINSYVTIAKVEWEE